MIGNWRSSGDMEPAKFGSLETGKVQETWNLRSSGVLELAKFRRPGTCEVRESGNWRSSGGLEPVKFGSLEEPRFGNSNER
jgi:hypothetical protein